MEFSKKIIVIKKARFDKRPCMWVFMSPRIATQVPSISVDVSFRNGLELRQVSFCAGLELLRSFNLDVAWSSELF